MQLPGMSFDPVRLSLEVTWWPDEDGLGLSRRLWTRPHRGQVWQLEDMATSGTLFREPELAERWTEASIVSLGYFKNLMNVQGDPF